jgi:glycosyltransferase involved in cell wall biosynthesis
MAEAASRVVLVGPSHPLRGGIAHHTEMLHRALARRFDVELIGFRRQYPDFAFPGRTQFDKSDRTTAVAGRRLIDSVNPLSWFVAFRAIRRASADCVVFQWWNPAVGVSLGTIAHLLRWFTNLRVVFICHNPEPHEPGWLDPLLTRYALSGAHRILVHAEAQRGTVERRWPHAEVVCHPHPIYDQFCGHGLSRTEARERLGLDGKLLLLFGYVRPYKGLGDLLHALQRLKPVLPVTLLVAGEFYLPRAPFDELIRTLGLEDEVRIVDRYIPNEQVELYFAAADAVVCPYLSASQSGVVQLAYGFGKPVICTRVGGLPEAVVEGETGFLANPRDPADLARAIQVFFDAAEAHDFAASIARIAPRFDWDGLVDAITRS